jgi:hypothetical protein
VTTEHIRTTAPTCDFCEAPNATFAYPVAAITLGTEQEIPAAHWTACIDCHLLIEEEDWDSLTASAGYPPGFAPTPVTAFRENRRGAAVQLTH